MSSILECTASIICFRKTKYEKLLAKYQLIYKKLQGRLQMKIRVLATYSDVANCKVTEKDIS